MKLLSAILPLIMLAVLCSCEKKPATTYIPRDLEDCFTQLDKTLPKRVKQSILTQSEEDFSISAHRDLGMWIRNNWGLGRDSRLAEYFRQKGLSHPDDMSGVILTSYHRHVTGREIKLDEQIHYYQNYWKIVQHPAENTFPKEAGHLQFEQAINYQRDNHEEGCVHIGVNAETGAIWLYDYHIGWAKTTQADLEDLTQGTGSPEQVLLKIYGRLKK